MTANVGESKIMISLPLFQATVLTAVRQLPESECYGLKIWERVCDLSAHEYDDGAVYYALKRLVDQNLLYVKNRDRKLYHTTFEGRCAHANFCLRIRRLLDD